MSGLSRRAVLRAAVLSAAATPFLSSQHASAAVSPPLIRSRFTPKLGAAFTMVSASGTGFPVTLQAINDLKPALLAGDPYRFSLLFVRSKNGGPPQGVYTFRAPGFTATSLLAVPVDRGRRNYEAIINRRP